MTEVVPKPTGFLRSWSNHLIHATTEPDGKTPSSARLLATGIILVVLLIQIGIVTILLVKLALLDPSLPNAPLLATVYLGLLRVILLFGSLFDLATALSFYGINVWKYLSGLANPLAGLAGGLSGDALKKFIEQAKHLHPDDPPKDDDDGSKDRPEEVTPVEQVEVKLATDPEKP